MKTSGNHSKAALVFHKDNISETDDIQPLRCWDCNLNFTNKLALYDHLLFHVRQPKIILNRIHLPPLKLTLKSTTGKQFQIVHSPTESGQNSPAENSEPEFNLAEEEETKETHSKSPLSYENRRQSEEEGYQTGEGQDDESNETLVEENKDQNEENVEQETITNTIEELDENIGNQDEPVAEDYDKNEENHDGQETNDQHTEEHLPNCEQDEDIIISNDLDNDEDTNFDSVPGAEPTPPPEPLPELPKIRIKTTGLLKEVKESSVTITEISDDDDSEKNNLDSEKLMMSGKDDILSFISNNERAKDFGFTTSDSEFLPADRIDDRNRPNNAMQIYNQGQMQGGNLGSIAGLPMEALAQQVSRLQPGNGMHQQNVLINIQQFPQAPPQPQYQPPPPPHMYHPPPQPMYHQPYQPYQPPPPPNPMYYQPAPGYPQHMPPPGQPQMPPMMGQVPVSQQQNVPPQAPQYRQPMMPIRPNVPPPRPMHPQRLPGNPRQPMMPSARPPMTRQRPPMPARPTGNGRGGMTAVRGIRPARMPAPVSQNGQVRQQQHQQMPMKRNLSEHQQNVQMKRKKLDVLTPDKDDDDCQVICMQPKNTDGGLPQIESVQGGTTEPENIMHLSDSITLSVRNPQSRPASPKKSDAKAVANILATRGITVTATAKPKQSKSEQGQKSSSPSASINLNGAVSIIPSAKSSATTKTTSSVPESNLPTVDLTDDTVTPPAPQQKQNNAVKPQRQSGLPFKCDLCPAQYPNAVGLSKHRQNYHKTTSGMCEIGVPLINLKQPGIFQKLSSIGINNYIPLHQTGPDSLFALPIINARNANSVAALGSATMLTLGPVRNIPRPNGANKQPNKKIS